MHAITGITGKVGGSVARTLLSAGEHVRAVVRDADKGRLWSGLGARISGTGAMFTQLLPFYDARVVDLCGAFERGLYFGDDYATRG